EARRQVFDGLLPTVAGAHRGEFNHRFAQPSVQASRGFGQLPPFCDEPQQDPRTGERQPGLLDRQRAAGGVPRIMYLNTAAEYWPGDVSRGSASLLHTDLAGQRDVEPPPEVRIYTFAGTQHGSGALPLRRVSATGSRAAHHLNVLDFTPLIRAALVNLERWVTRGEEPPPSLFPRLADGTAVPLATVLDRLRAIPGISLPDAEQLPAPRRLDLGPEAANGIGRYPVQTGAAYPRFVSAVDEDGNELGGIRLPDLVHPVATYTGWNPRAPETGGTGQLVMMWGSTLPFPATAARQRNGDPRAAIGERYRDREDYRARVQTAAEQLAAQGYLLNEDVPLVVQLALGRYDAFAAVPTAAGDGAGG
ncbi:MAG TPA: alpha/beta hydrolase domain-containing protein, partial [Dehalococcoidia bacterium]|nr:alpha/beta hydrolase domain-containing protein [Dehalococcoidia bacterium]